MKVSFKIPGKPLGWDRVQPTARVYDTIDGPKAIASMHDSKENKAAKAEIARLYRVASGTARPIIGPVRMKITGVFEWFESWPREVQKAAAETRVWHVAKPDLDNIEKLILDALNKLAWVDDGQVCIVEKCKRYGKPARVDVTISAIKQQPDEITPAQKRLEKRVAKEGWDAVLAGPAKRGNQPKADIPLRMLAAEFRKHNPRSKR